MAEQTILLASYPRSGNSLLRTILKGAFGLYSTTAYPTEKYGETLADRLGHIDTADADRVAELNGGLKIVKTHEYPGDCTYPAIYMVRDGREACVSYVKFSRQFGVVDYTLDDVIRGRCRYSSWSDHIRGWRIGTRPDTLVLRYSDAANDSAATIRAIAKFLSREPVGGDVPTFGEMQGLNGDFFRAGTNTTWRDAMTDEQHELFWQMHGLTMERFGYTRDACPTAG